VVSPLEALESVINSITKGDQIWGKNIHIEKAAFDPTGLPTEAEIDQMLDVSLLAWPYVSVLREGNVPDVKSYTRSRNVIGHLRDGFVDGPCVRRLMSQGGTLKLNRMSDWSRAVRSLKELVEERLPVAVSTYGFLTPAESQGMLPHRDASHVLVLQLCGQKYWRLFAHPGQVRGTSGLDVDADKGPSHEFTLNAGDILYLPHGWPHLAKTPSRSSLHLTLTLTEPTAEDLLQGILRLTAEKNAGFYRHYHELDVPGRAAEIASKLARAEEFDDVALRDAALSSMRKSHG
jgi:hypothetical protein